MVRKARHYLEKGARRWANDAPDRTFLGERAGDGAGLTLSYVDAGRKAYLIAQALINGRMEPNRPILVFNGRVVEDFKLNTGTWVHVDGPRVGVLAAAAP